jgi:hypothetical protein
MDESFLTDEISIISVTTDINGVITESLPNTVKARISEKNRLILDLNGKEVTSEIKIILDSSVSIKYQDKIIIKKLCGSVYLLNTKQWQIKQISTGHLYESDHTEIWL